MLSARLILGPLIIAALVGLCWLDAHASQPGIFLLPLAIVVGLAGANELLTMWRRRDDRPQPLPWVVYVGTLITILAAGAPVWAPNHWGADSAIGDLGWLAIGLIVSLLLALIGEMRRFDGSGSATMSLALACFAVTYVGGLVGMLVQLRLLRGRPLGYDGWWGMLALLSMIAAVKMSDIGQYTVGRLIGRHKLAPAISPGKTWEGAIGGLVFAIVAAELLIPAWASNRIEGGEPAYGTNTGLIAVGIYAVAVAIAGILGDLAESLLKRDAGVKDSSTWLPGYGGVLDLLDSLLGAAPVAYLFWALHWVGP